MKKKIKSRISRKASFLIAFVSCVFFALYFFFSASLAAEKVSDITACKSLSLSCGEFCDLNKGHYFTGSKNRSYRFSSIGPNQCSSLLRNKYLFYTSTSIEPPRTIPDHFFNKFTLSGRTTLRSSYFSDNRLGNENIVLDWSKAEINDMILRIRNRSEKSTYGINRTNDVF